jgi:hypothetical protein
VGSTRVASGPWKTRIEQGRVPYSRSTIEKKHHPRTPVNYLNCKSETNINIQRNTKSYNVDHNLHGLERNICSGKTPNNLYNKYSFYNTTVEYNDYSLMTYNLLSNRIMSFPVLSYIFLH